MKDTKYPKTEIRNALKTLFNKKTMEDKLYTHLRSSRYKGDIREYFAKLLIESTKWGGVDEHFHNDFHKKLVQRWWELLIGYWLVKKFPQKIKSSSVGPDYLLEHKVGNVYIECIAPENEKGAPNLRDSKRTGGYLNGDTALLRFTGAVKEKSQKIERYLKKAYINKHDPVVIAVNLMEIPDVDLMQAHSMPFAVRGLLGMGEYVMKIPVLNPDGTYVAKKKQIPKVVPNYVSEIPTKNNAPVELRKFLTKEYAHISAIITSYDRYVEMPDCGKRFIILHNPNATNPLPIGIFKNVDSEYYCDENHLFCKKRKK